MLKSMGRARQRRWGTMGENRNHKALLSLAAAALKGVSQGAIHIATPEGRPPVMSAEKPAASWRIDRHGTSSAGGHWKAEKTNLDTWQPVHGFHERKKHSGWLKKDRGASQDVER